MSISGIETHIDLSMTHRYARNGSKVLILGFCKKKAKHNRNSCPIKVLHSDIKGTLSSSKNFLYVVKIESRIL